MCLARSGILVKVHAVPSTVLVFYKLEVVGTQTKWLQNAVSEAL